MVELFHKLAPKSAAKILAAAQAYAWPTRDAESTYRTFTSRATAEAWGASLSIEAPARGCRIVLRIPSARSAAT